MSDLQDVIIALTVEGEEVDRLVADLTVGQWATPTPSPGWTVKHQLAHLAATFRMAGLAASDPAAFGALAQTLSPDFDANVNAALSQYINDPTEVLLSRWRTDRDNAIKALAAVPADTVVPWLVRPLPPAILACAGMMELFGHGQDIADALGVRRAHSDRLRYLVAFAVRTWDFGYLARELPTPEVEFRFEITGPSGALWEFGPADAVNRISGPAVDFCLLVTRRRHHSDLSIKAGGPEATAWVEIAQAYRGPAGDGREPGQFAA
ncbi:TIGR03084 family metal-binding protein [Actinokineospora sp.]|uniref:TIGR03084 family metal-binding protein n=1 Tax=Actinokineospora sp. TaxID=1872133 RepID=UPI003D6AF7DC